MNKIIIKSVFGAIVPAMLAVAFITGPALADDKDKKEPPPKEGEACSPGFWKNHPDLWMDVCCTGILCDEIDAHLRAKGFGSSAIRQNAADFLEMCLGRPCNDE